MADLNGDGYFEVLVGDGGGKVWAFDRYGNRLPGVPGKPGFCFKLLSLQDQHRVPK
ncbi:MAG: hypothetical protein ACRDH2_07660 [Anaerolineales bacterium]